MVFQCINIRQVPWEVLNLIHGNACLIPILWCFDLQRIDIVVSSFGFIYILQAQRQPTWKRHRDAFKRSMKAFDSKTTYKQEFYAKVIIVRMCPVYLDSFTSRGLFYYNSLDRSISKSGCLVSFLLLSCFIDTSVFNANC